jgi:hypothetical protein
MGNRWANNGEIPYYFTEKYMSESITRGFSVWRTGLETKVSVVRFVTLDNSKR